VGAGTPRTAAAGVDRCASRISRPFFPNLYNP